MKLRKIFSAILAAAMCVTMAATVSADETKTAAAATTYYQDAKDLSGAKYYPSLMKLAEKYYAKEQKNTITYGKSMTKKFMVRLAKAYGAENIQYSIDICDGKTISSAAVKGDNVKYVVADDTALVAMFADKDEVTMIIGAEGTNVYMTTPNDGSMGAEAVAEEMEGVDLDAVDSSASDNVKGKYFKIKYKEKIYIYEQFGDEAFLFTEKGTPVVMMDDEETYSIQVAFNVKDSAFDFTIPKNYVEVTE